jgi:hypothetical protein
LAIKRSAPAAQESRNTPAAAMTAPLLIVISQRPARGIDTLAAPLPGTDRGQKQKITHVPFSWFLAGYQTQRLQWEVFAWPNGGWPLSFEVAILPSKEGGKILEVNFLLRYGLADTLQIVNMLD